MTHEGVLSYYRFKAKGSSLDYYLQARPLFIKQPYFCTTVQ